MHTDLNSSYFFSKKEVSLEWDSVEERIPHFRLFNDILGKSLTDQQISSTGVEGHYLSASGQFSAKNIGQLSEHIQQFAQAINKIIVIDLRQESHGFINGLPVTWTSEYNQANKGMSLHDIQEDENRRLKNLEHRGLIDGQIINEATTEQALIESHTPWIYNRIPVLDHSIPTHAQIDFFLSLIKQNKTNWIHLHCKGGKGRSSLFTAIADIFFNAKLVSFEDILKRQKAIGGTDLKKHLTKEYKDLIKKQLAKERLEFLQKFYVFCLEADLESTTWTEWIEAHEVTEPTKSN